MIRISVDGPADADLVWHRYTTPELWPTWAPHMSGVSYDDEVISVGGRGHVRGAGLSIPFLITAVNHAERTWSWRVGGRLGVDLQHQVVDNGAGSTASLTGPVWLIPVYAPLARFALKRLVSSRS